MMYTHKPSYICMDSMTRFVKVTWEGAFAKHAMALPNQLAIPQAEECAEEIPKCRLGRYRNNAFHQVARQVDTARATCHVRIKAKFPKAARVTGSRRICLARAVFDRSLLGLAWPVNIGCNSTSVGEAACPDFPGSIFAV